MKERIVTVWVHPLFKKKLKNESVQNDMSMIEYTKYLATDTYLSEQFKKEKEKRGFKLEF